MAGNNRPPLQRQSSLTPEPKPLNEEQQCHLRASIEMDSNEENVFSAVAAAMEMHYDEKIVLSAIAFLQEEKPATAENAESKKVGPNDDGAKLPG